MHNYFSHSSQIKKYFIEAAAQKMGVNTSIIEKDLWVTISLQALFSDMTSDDFVFKGGTSLSKAYGIIERFSEDIDVTINRSIFGPHFSLADLAQLGRKERERIIEDIKNKAHQHIKSQIIPTLKTRMEALSREKIRIDFSEEDPLSVEIYYPSLFIEKYSYIKPRIYIEFGIRGALEPHDDRPITSYLHQHISEISSTHIDVRVLSPVRTFYEKATILHQEAHREKDRETPERLSRHYYDLHQLVLKDYLKKATEEIELLKAVINHKILLFPSAWAQYDTILTQGIRLIPSENRIKDLRADYQQMTEMFFGDYPSMEDILSTIEFTEKALNQAIREK